MPLDTLLHKGLKVQLDPEGDGTGTFRATFATFNEVDHDKDVTLPGAFPAGKSVLISAYMHGSWMGALPVGKGIVQQDGQKAWVDGSFFLDTIDGLNHYRTVKAVGDLQEWSYGYDVKQSSRDSSELKNWPGAQQILKEVDVLEVSPVLFGAGINTRTDYVKNRKAAEDVTHEDLRDRLTDAITALYATADDPNPWVYLRATTDTTAAYELEGTDQAGQYRVSYTVADDGTISLGTPERVVISTTVTVAAADGKFLEAVPDFLSTVGYGQALELAVGAAKAIVERSRVRAAFRERKEGRTLSAANRERLAALHQTMQGLMGDLQDLLDATDPQATDGKAGEVDEEVLAIWLENQRRAFDLSRV